LVETPLKEREGTPIEQNLGGSKLVFLEPSKIEISGNEKKIENWLGLEPAKAFKDVEVLWRNPKDFEGETGVVSVVLSTPIGNIVLE
jgi:hypothetical protein